MLASFVRQTGSVIVATMESNTARAVFLDRDGVIVRPEVRDNRPFAASRAEALELMPGAAEAVRRFRVAGFLTVVVTNQPDVARGTHQRTEIETMHAHLMEVLDLDDIRVCYHDDADDCPCRKPRPGMLTAAAEDLGISLTDSFMIGDRWRDVGAGRAAGCTTVFIDYRYDERRPESPDYTVASLDEAVTVILEC